MENIWVERVMEPITLMEVKIVIIQQLIKNRTTLEHNTTQNIFNTRIIYFPGQWEKGDVKLLEKTRKDKRQPVNYRPISRLLTLVKLF